jgi:hypothetical protein
MIAFELRRSLTEIRINIGPKKTFSSPERLAGVPNPPAPS